MSSVACVYFEMRVTADFYLWYKMKQNKTLNVVITIMKLYNIYQLFTKYCVFVSGASFVLKLYIYGTSFSANQVAFRKILKLLSRSYCKCFYLTVLSKSSLVRLRRKKYRKIPILHYLMSMICQLFVRIQTLL